jgi:hypothetical protein
MMQSSYFCLEELINACNQKVPLTLSSSDYSAVMRWEQLQMEFLGWVQEKFLREYDVIVSYRWNEYDSTIAVRVSHGFPIKL